MTTTRDVEILRAAIVDASALALDWFNRRPKGRQKADGSAVSDADLAVDALLQDRLRSARPDYGWLSEESGSSPDRLDCARVWLVDPIDGTSAFLSGSDTFTVSAALVENGVPIAAALAAPALGEVYIAQRGAGASVNGELQTPPDRRQTLDGAVLLGGSSVVEGLHGATAGPFSGSIVHRICMAALGRVDGALSTTALHEWDLCGAHLFAEELGLTITDASGQDLTYNKPDPVAPGAICGSARLVAEILTGLSNPRQIPS